MRIGCVFIPDIFLSAHLRAEPELRGLSVAVLSAAGASGRVIECSESARAGGVRPDMSAACARGLIPGIVFREHSPERTRAALAALGDAVRKITPRVEISGGPEIFCDASGLSRRYPSERALASALWAAAGAAGLEAWVGIASGRAAASLAARAGRGAVALSPEEETAFLAPLPVSLLGGPADVQAALRRFGISRLGDLSALSAAEVGLRLGPEGLRLWRLSRGADREPFCGAPEPECFSESEDWDEPLECLGPLLDGFERRLERLFQRLSERGLAARRLRLVLGLYPRGQDPRALEAAAPTVSVSLWRSLAALSLERTPPSAPVVSLRIETENESPRPCQGDLFRPAGPAPSRLAETLARLALWCGADRVGSPRPRDGWLPGEYELAPFGSGGAGALPRPGGGVLRMVRPPRKIQVALEGERPARLGGDGPRGRVRRLAGPWRVSGGWWEEPFARDYFDVELGEGRVYRIFRERGCWYLSGACG